MMMMKMKMMIKMLVAGDQVTISSRASARRRM